MSHFFRQTIYFLVFTFVFNAMGWTFNKEAVADIWLNDLQCESKDGLSAKHPDLNTIPSESPCNHWCNTISHLIGLHSDTGFITLEFSNTYARLLPSRIQFFAPDGRFRPPRILS